ncbi:MAG: T9SS type A sorting domain-containing protein [Bacteroidales bacterium]|nr:T9SS type A sorting domain-containing protein [Bacteroidales bacterium]
MLEMLFRYIKMKNVSHLLIFLFSILFASNLNAQPGSLDKSFGINGIVTTSMGARDAKVASIAIQTDSKIVTAGYSNNGKNLDFALARYDTNGYLDETFGNNGRVITEIGSGDNSIRSVIIQPDGKLVVSGYCPDSSFYDFASARYNPDGSLDKSFGIDGIIITSFGDFSGAFSSAIQDDEKIVVAGFMGSQNSLGHNVFALIRYNTNGTLDSTFGINGKVTTAIRNINDVATSIGIQPDGKIVVAGYSYYQNNNGQGPDFALARYNSNGTIDTTFSLEGKVITIIGRFSLATKLTILNDNKILVSGSTYNGSNWDFALAQYNTDGSIDNSFGTGGIVTTSLGFGNDYAYSSMTQPDHKIIVTGSSADVSHTNFALVRYNQDGSLDNTFGSDGIVTTAIDSNNSYLFSVVMQKNGEIVAAGSTSINDTIASFALARYNSGLNLGIVDNPVSDNSVLVFPNPIGQQATLEYVLNFEETVSIRLIDMNGITIKIFQNNQKQEAGLHEQQINLPDDLPQGIYFIILSVAGRQVSIKIVKK